MPTDTIKQLAAITDAAQFERIATSVLRSAKPSLYANISHQGVNTDGKTVKAPLDNVGWVRTGRESMLVAAAHTTASRDDLEGKWLHDPETVTPRKKGGKPTQPAGDLVKAIGELEKLRMASPGLKATLALTCNREEPADVRVKAEALAGAADVSLDIWSVSRIAQHLDTTADGQAIRHAYLGSPAALLSKAELIRAGHLSLGARTRPTDPSSMIDRTAQIGGRGHVILSGASGMGKTTLCLELLRTSLANGQAGLVLSDQTLRDATSIEEAIDMELRRHLPYLEPLAGSKALDLCGEPTPLVIVIEDISRAENTVGLLNKVVAWALSSISKEATSSRRNWRLLCPVWTRFLPGIEKSKDAYAAGIIQSVGLYSEKEASEAVKCRGEVLGKPQSDMSAAAIARALGRDPLLIGLHEFTGTRDILGLWIENTEGAKFWMKVFNDLKTRGCNDILIAVTDGLKGMGEALGAVFPATTLQTCIVHLIRNSLDYAIWKDRKALAAAIKPIYTAPSAEAALCELDAFADGPWGQKFPTVAAAWRRAWDKVIPLFAFAPAIRRVIYTTNAIESVNARLRKPGGHFPSDDAASKLIWLALRNITADWGRASRDWKDAMNQFAIIYDERFSKAFA